MQETCLGDLLWILNLGMGAFELGSLRIREIQESCVFHSHLSKALFGCWEFFSARRELPGSESLKNPMVINPQSPVVVQVVPYSK